MYKILLIHNENSMHKMSKRNESCFEKKSFLQLEISGSGAKCVEEHYKCCRQTCEEFISIEEFKKKSFFSLLSGLLKLQRQLIMMMLKLMLHDVTK